jgi:hypothetical protein
VSAWTKINARETGIRTPIGLVSSVNAQELDVQMQFPAMGSQNGVEQFWGTKRKKDRFSVRLNWVEETIDERTSEPGLLATRGLLCRIRIAG